MKKIKIKYRRSHFTVKVPDNYEMKCEIPGCNRSNNPKGIHHHHYKYEFKTKEVRKNPQLALKNTIKLCFFHHRIADAIRFLLDNQEEAVKVIDKITEKIGYKENIHDFINN